MDKVNIYKVTYRITVPHLSVRNFEDFTYTPHRSMEKIINMLHRKYTDKVDIDLTSIAIEPTNIHNVYIPYSFGDSLCPKLVVVKFVKQKHTGFEGWRDQKVLFRVLAKDFADAYKIVQNNDELSRLLPEDGCYRVKSSLVDVRV